MLSVSFVLAPNNLLHSAATSLTLWLELDNQRPARFMNVCYSWSCLGRKICLEIPVDSNAETLWAWRRTLGKVV